MYTAGCRTTKWFFWKTHTTLIHMSVTLKYEGIDLNSYGEQELPVQMESAGRWSHPRPLLSTPVRGIYGADGPQISTWNKRTLDSCCLSLLDISYLFQEHFPLYKISKKKEEEKTQDWKHMLDWNPTRMAPIGFPSSSTKYISKKCQLFISKSALELLLFRWGGGKERLEGKQFLHVQNSTIRLWTIRPILKCLL